MTMTYTVEDFVASMHGAEISAAPGDVTELQSLNSSPNPDFANFADLARAIVAVPKAEAEAVEVARPKRSQRSS